MAELSRRTFLAASTVLVATPAVAAASAPDPLLELINELKAGDAAFAAGPSIMTTEEENALIATTYGPPWQRVVNDCPIPTTAAGAIAALEYALTQMPDDFEASVMEAVIEFLEAGRLA